MISELNIEWCASETLDPRVTKIRNGRTIFTSGEFGLLQMVLELNTSIPMRMLGLNGWIVRFHISWREKRNIAYKGVETSP